MKSERYRSLLESNPQSELFQFSLAQALLEEGQPEEALDRFQTCLEAKPEWMVASILKSKCLIALGRNADARTELERSLQLAISQRHEDPEKEVRKLLAGL